jgi:fused signal recognition particle receptor
MFGFIKDKIKKIYTSFTTQVSNIFSRNNLDEQFLQELSVLLLSADTGVKTTNQIIEKLRNDIKDTKITTLEQAKDELEKQLLAHLQQAQSTEQLPRVLLLVGINGSGKTTFVGKFANKLKQDGKRVIVVAGDTFRAAATQQLSEWAKRVDVPVFIGKEDQDPAAVIFDACKKFKDESFDHIIIDTAGRLQTKVNLMRELEKMRKIIDRQLPGEPVSTWLTIDSMLGQNSFQQAELFNEATKLNGLVLTKLDGTGKGGIVFSITQKLGIPIVYITFGEALDDIKEFDSADYIKGLLHE